MQTLKVIREKKENAWISSMCLLEETTSPVILYSSRDGSIGKLQLGDDMVESEQICKGHQQRVTQITADFGNTLAVSGGWDKKIIVWDVREEVKIKQEIKQAHGDDVLGVTIFKKKEIYSCGRDGAVNVFDIETGTKIQSFQEHNTPVMCIESSPDNSCVVSVGSDSTIKKWDSRVPGRSVTSINPGVELAPRTMEISPDGSILEIGGKKGILQLYDLVKAELLYELPSTDALPAFDMNFSPTRYWSIAATSTGIYIWDLEVKAIVHQIIRENKQTPIAIVWNSHGTRLYTAYSDGCLCLWQPLY